MNKYEVTRLDGYDKKTNRPAYTIQIVEADSFDLVTAQGYTVGTTFLVNKEPIAFFAGQPSSIIKIG